MNNVREHVTIKEIVFYKWQNKFNKKHFVECINELLIMKRSIFIVIKWFRIENDIFFLPWVFKIVFDF